MTDFWTTWGAGPRWGLASLPFLVTATALHVLCYPRFVITQLPYPALALPGGFLIVGGVYVYVAAARELRKRVRKGSLAFLASLTPSHRSTM